MLGAAQKLVAPLGGGGGFGSLGGFILYYQATLPLSPTLILTLPLTPDPHPNPHPKPASSCTTRRPR